MDIRAVTSHAFVQDNVCQVLENVVKNVYNVSGKEPTLLNFTEPLLNHSTLVTEQLSSPYKITEEQIDFFFFFMDAESVLKRKLPLLSYARSPQGW